jgi:hypothetical protein
MYTMNGSFIMVEINYTYYLIIDIQLLKINKDILDRVDKYGHKIDFLFCFKCYILSIYLNAYLEMTLYVNIVIPIILFNNDKKIE